MGSDKKQRVDWATPSEEQGTFGSQSPYASAAQPTAPFREGGPSHQTHDMMDAPPMYTPDQAQYQPPHHPPPPLQQQQEQHPQYQPPHHPPPPLPQQQEQYLQHPAQAVPRDASVPFYAPPQEPLSPVPPPKQPEYQQPLLSSYPRQPQQYPQHHRGAGATSNPYGNYSTFPKPPNGDDSSNDGVPRRHVTRREKKSCSFCSCCCLTFLLIIFLCWNLKAFIVIRDGVCWVGPDAEFRSETETVSASYDLNLDFLVLDGITGNVVVKESESFDTEDVRINVVMYATTTKLLDQLQHSIVRDTPNIAHARVHINDQMDKDAKKKLLRGGCARADVEIIYPRSNPGTGKLSIVATNGELLMKMSPKHTRASFEEVKLSLSNGDVNVDNVVVSKTFLAEVANGNVNGGIRSAGKVTVNTVNGPVTLKIDAAPLNQSWGESKLVVDIYTVNGLIGLDLVQRFLGHFDLVNANGNKAIRLASDSKDIITYSAQGSKQLTGWISQDGVEPASPSPRLTLLNVNGAIKLNVETMT